MLPFFYAFYRLGRGVLGAFKDPEFEVLLTLTAVVLATGTIFYHDVEGWTYLDSLYFSVVTLTTVGYGDLSPHSTVSKIFTMVYLLVGIGILFGFINTVAHYAIEDSRKNGVLIPKRNVFSFRRREVEPNEPVETT
ncbi:MAG TPA: potassium channel family protein [Candidatus Paceibacterota bacterium]|nr:potassium channel family protein [Candidatus Paceibacterota bacterium]